MLTPDTANLVWPNWPPAMWTGFVKRPLPCSVLVVLSPQSGGPILSKGILLSCSIQRRNLAAPVPITWRWQGFPCHFVWGLGVGRDTLCHLARWLWNDKIGTPLLPCLACLALTQVFPATLFHSLGVDISAPCHLVWWLVVDRNILCHNARLKWD